MVCSTTREERGEIIHVHVHLSCIDLPLTKLGGLSNTILEGGEREGEKKREGEREKEGSDLNPSCCLSYML